MTSKSVLGEVRQVQLAIELIGLGARLQFLEAAVTLSRERLIRLYKELKGVSPPKGLLPFSTDWYMTWLANIHSSMFYNIYRFMLDEADENELPALIKAYRLYAQQVEANGGEVVLDFTRAETMVRFFDSDMLQLSTCSLRRAFRGPCARQQERVRVRAVQAAFAGGQGTQAQGDGAPARRPGRGGARDGHRRRRLGRVPARGHGRRGLC